jgi:hypothetical protein
VNDDVCDHDGDVFSHLFHHDVRDCGHVHLQVLYRQGVRGRIQRKIEDKGEGRFLLVLALK